jgi:hypothetical protein
VKQRKGPEKEQKVILAVEPLLLREMLFHVLRKHAQVRVISGSEVTDWEALSYLIEEMDARWLILSLPNNDQLPADAGDLLNVHPNLCLIAMALDGSVVKLRWLESQEHSFDYLTLDTLISVIQQDTSLREIVLNP